MYKKVIEYEDFDGNKRKEEHYFNLTKAEVIRWLTTTGEYTLDKKLEQLSVERNNLEILKIFEDLIQMSYGKKSLDGRRFDKTEETKRDFMETEAYSVLLTELLGDAKKAAAFINGIIPKDLSDEIDRMMKENPPKLEAV